MITAQIVTGADDMLLRDRIRVVAFFDDGRERVVIGRNAEGHEYQYVVNGDDLPEGVSLHALDARTDVARAVYLALKEHFEPKDQVPTIADRAYLDARADLQRAHALIDKLVEKLAPPPFVEAAEMVSGGH